MYHGGTNPEGKLHTLNEVQISPATANNDMPVCTYDFQAPLGEFGQTNESYYRLRPLHLFMQDYGELLAPMEASYPSPQNVQKGDDSALRWAYRSKDGKGFVFINNYERLQNLSAKKNVEFEVCGVKLPKMTVPAGCMAVFPIGIDGIRYATCQLVAHRNGMIYMMQIKGIPSTICMQNGKTLKNVKPKGANTPVYKNICLLTQEEAESLFLDSVAKYDVVGKVTFAKVKEAGSLRTVKKGRAKVAEAPGEQDWEQAAVYKIALDDADSRDARLLLNIEYQGDCARLYADGRLVADNFQYGRPFLYGLWRLSAGVKELELRILPMQSDMPVYLPREADKTPGASVKSITVTKE